MGPPVGVLGVFVLLAVVVALSAVDPSGDGTRAQATTATPGPVDTPAADAAPPVATAPAARTVTRRVAGRRVSADLEPGWTVRRRDRGLTFAGPDGTRVRVSAGPREGRDLRRLGRDARRALVPRDTAPARRRGAAGRSRDTPPARRRGAAGRSRVTAPLRRTTIGGRPAVAVTAAGQQVVQLVDGPRRWLISRPADADADAGAPLVRSLRIRRGA